MKDEILDNYIKANDSLQSAITIAKICGDFLKDRKMKPVLTGVLRNLEDSVVDAQERLKRIYELAEAQEGGAEHE